MDTWRYALVIAGSLLNLLSVVPYIIATVKRTTKPRIVSWFVWTVLTALGCAAAVATHSWLTTILLGASALSTLTIVVVGWRNGDRHFAFLDIVCLVGAIGGIILWQLFNSPVIGTLAAVGLDLIAGIPTLVHAWKKPHEETWQTFLLSFFAASLALVALNDWQPTASVYPVYLVVINLLFTLVIVGRLRKIRRK